MALLATSTAVALQQPLRLMLCQPLQASPGACHTPGGHGSGQKGSSCGGGSWCELLGRSRVGQSVRQSSRARGASEQRAQRLVPSRHAVPGSTGGARNLQPLRVCERLPSAASCRCSLTAGVPQDEEGPQDIETTIRELQVRPGFEGYFLFNDLGIPIKWSSSGFGENSASSGVIIPREVTHFAALMADLSAKSQDTCDHLFADKVSARSTGRQPVPLRPPSRVRRARHARHNGMARPGVRAQGTCPPHSRSTTDATRSLALVTHAPVTAGPRRHASAVHPPAHAEARDHRGAGRRVHAGGAAGGSILHGRLC